MSMQDNKEVVRRYFEEFHSKRTLSLADVILGPQLRDATMSAAHMLTTAFPDYQITILDQIVEEDKVATVWKTHGTHERVWMSPMGPIPPTNKSVTWTGTTTLRLVDGQISEVIGTNWDHLGILQHMGALSVTIPRSGA